MLEFSESVEFRKNSGESKVTGANVCSDKTSGLFSAVASFYNCPIPPCGHKKVAEIVKLSMILCLRSSLGFRKFLASGTQNSFEVTLVWN